MKIIKPGQLVVSNAKDKEVKLVMRSMNTGDNGYRIFGGTDYLVMVINQDQSQSMHLASTLKILSQ